MVHQIYEAGHRFDTSWVKELVDKGFYREWNANFYRTTKHQGRMNYYNLVFYLSYIR